jgi:hypothetical protein
MVNILHSGSQNNWLYLTHINKLAILTGVALAKLVNATFYRMLLKSGHTGNVSNFRLVDFAISQSTCAS